MGVDVTPSSNEAEGLGLLGRIWKHLYTRLVRLGADGASCRIEANVTRTPQPFIEYDDVTTHSWRYSDSGADPVPFVDANHRHALVSSTDVSVTVPAHRELLMYDDTVSKWVNADPGRVSHDALGDLGGDGHPQYFNHARHDTPTAHDSGVVDHGRIGGLTDDDHTQYLNVVRHDVYARHGDTAVDHGLIAGLADDDHPQYVRADGTRCFTGPVQGVDPVTPNDLATRGFVISLFHGLDWQNSVKRMDQTTPPIQPTAGDRYLLLPDGLQGDWSGHRYQIAEFQSDNTWLFYMPENGWTVLVETVTTLNGDVSVNYTWNGTSWIPTGSTSNHNEMGNLQGGGGGLYFHLSQAQYEGLLAAMTDSKPDHSKLENLSADAHTQYARVDGGRAFTAVVSGVTPTADAHLATKQYVDGKTDALTLQGHSYADVSSMAMVKAIIFGG